MQMILLGSSHSAISICISRHFITGANYAIRDHNAPAAWGPSIVELNQTTAGSYRKCAVRLHQFRRGEAKKVGSFGEGASFLYTAQLGAGRLMRERCESAP
jgi:hypothetical protein